MVIVKNVTGSKNYDEKTLGLLKEAGVFARDYLEIDKDHKIFVGAYDKTKDSKYQSKRKTVVMGSCHNITEDITLVYVYMEMPQWIVLETLFHEMVHAKQYSKGELKEGENDSKRYWKGKPFGHVKTRKEYLQLPWEAEAREIASEILLFWMIHRFKIRIRNFIKGLPVLKKLV